MSLSYNPFYRRNKKEFLLSFLYHSRNSFFQLFLSTREIDIASLKFNLISYSGENPKHSLSQQRHVASTKRTTSVITASPPEATSANNYHNILGQLTPEVREKFRRIEIYIGTKLKYLPAAFCALKRGETFVSCVEYHGLSFLTNHEHDF